MLAKAHTRRFGVEIECGYPGGSEAARYLFPGWRVGHDGSGVEVRTEILQGERGFEQLRLAMDRLRSGGGYVTRADGMHVHHDAPEFRHNPNLCLRLVESWNNNLHAIHEMVDPYRRSSGACPRWRPHEVESIKTWADGGMMYASRNDLNLNSLRRHGSIEIRLHEGTLDPDVAIAWIKFGQRFIDDVVRRAKPIKGLMRDEDLLDRIKLSKSAQRILAAKKAAGHRTSLTSHRSH